MKNTLTSIVGKSLTVLGLASAVSLNSGCIITFQSPLNLEARLAEEQPPKHLSVSRRYDTTAHQFLDLESELGATDDDYIVLDDVIDKAKEAIRELKLEKPVADYDNYEALSVLKAIDKTLKREGFSYKKNLLLNEGLKTKKIDCDNTSMIYLAIGEELNLPLKMVLAPRHSFIRWHFSDGYFNWETTIGKNVIRNVYVSNLNISEQAINNGLYLKSLDKKEVLAIQHFNIGTIWLEKNDYEKAAQNFNEALILNPKLTPAYNNLGITWYSIDNPEKAIQKYDLAIEFDPNCLEAYANKWIALTTLGRFTDANNVMNKVDKLGINNRPDLRQLIEHLSEDKSILRPVKRDWPSVL
ncbi:MAG: tetratricopeptide repeat protein [Nanoarchaeota archaeon]|nr:tetratricopeptide repeat protein [Nanoarchaeota archaeon]MBU1632196.1 tetratricopeptide repeat protein [Nanoarchaeota archaeon]MBU1875583.1 tetratricopeptide repeat protein [Nanoarchaeota archaeon]